MIRVGSASLQSCTCDRDLLLSSKAVIEALPASGRRAKIAEVLKQRFAQSETNKVYQALRQDGRPAIQYFRELDGLRADIPSPISPTESCVSLLCKVWTLMSSGRSRCSSASVVTITRP